MLARAERPSRLGLALVALLGLLGVAYVKWWPYGRRLATGDLAFGRPLIDVAPLDYALRYAAEVWPALALGIFLAAAVEAALPRSWVVERLGRVSVRAAALGGLASLPTMLCTCCAAPVAVGLRRGGSSAGAALAFWLGNPLLNPAVLAFLLLALPWPFAALRLAAGVVIVFGLCHLVGRLAPAPVDALAPRTDAEAGGARSVPRIALRYALVLVPEWIVLALAVGAARAWLVPAVHGVPANDPLALAVAAVGGALFVIPTAGEVPIAQALLGLGVGAGPVAAALVTLPALSLPSLVMVRRAFPARALVATAALVVIVGALAGLAAEALIPPDSAGAARSGGVTKTMSFEAVFPREGRCLEAIVRL